MLDLAAGEAALKKCGVDLVAGFLHEAVKLSKYVDWEESYDVVLQVYTLSAEVESSRGNFVRSSELVDIILEKVKSPEVVFMPDLCGRKHCACSFNSYLLLKNCRRLLRSVGKGSRSRTTAMFRSSCEKHDVF
jgi:hypothetical protein